MDSMEHMQSYNELDSDFEEDEDEAEDEEVDEEDKGRSRPVVVSIVHLAWSGAHY